MDIRKSPAEQDMALVSFYKQPNVEWGRPLNCRLEGNSNYKSQLSKTNLSIYSVFILSNFTLCYRRYCYWTWCNSFFFLHMHGEAEVRLLHQFWYVCNRILPNASCITFFLIILSIKVYGILLYPESSKGSSKCIMPVLMISLTLE